MDVKEKDKFYDFIVIGGGVAGVSCAEQLYNYDDSCSILLISASDYVKTVTNVHYLTKTLDYFDVEEKSPDVLEKRCPTITVLKSVVKRLDSEHQIVYTEEKGFCYSKICICSGAVPKVIFPSNPNVLWIRDTESVTKFQQKIRKSKRIVIVGNGGIATEMVYEITGIEIIWAIKDKFFNSVFIDPGAAEFLRSKLEEDKPDDCSISKRQKYTIDSFEAQTNSGLIGGALGPDWHSALNLESAKERKVILETEVEVQSILSPQELESSKHLDPEVHLKGNNFKVGEDGGLLVNDKMETSLKNVYAAGDVCSAGWDVAQHWFQLRLWTQARQMGSYAAKCMWASASREEVYMDFCFEMFSHATKFLGHKVVLLGLFNGQTLKGKYEMLLRMTKGKEYIKCVMSEGRMQGAILIGETDLEETFENLILNQMDLSSYGEDLLDPSVDIEDYFD
ncbi:UNVERIFIED_CONTAM: hypothetical protein GTU68_036579 [Idotea baltica]|nr:hypothetical protein [Idotea baltica]